MIRKKSTNFRLFLALLVIAAGLLWTGTFAFDDRVITLRYFLFTLSGFIAFVTPYLIFPDPNSVLVQLANLTGKQLLKYILDGFASYQWPLLLLLTVIVIGDVSNPVDHLSDKLFYLFYSLSLFGGLNLIALSRYIRSGIDSQFWQESEKGRLMRKRFADYFKYPLDPGTIPSMINTFLISASGMIAVVAGAYLFNRFGILAEMSAGIVVLFIGLLSFLKLKKDTERHYYSTNAFYGEFFDSGTGGESVVERRKADQLWWVPAGIRADVWQFLQQTDRKIPAGRVVAAGHLFIWFVAYQRPGEEFITALWILFAAAHHLFILLTMQQSLAPAWLLRWIDNRFNWFLTRFWMQLRWLLPLLVSMNGQQFVFGFPGWQTQFIILLIYLLSGALLSAVAAVQLNKDIQ